MVFEIFLKEGIETFLYGKILTVGAHKLVFRYLPIR